MAPVQAFDQITVDEAELLLERARDEILSNFQAVVANLKL